jgi:uncharacterized protein (DUF302 family)
MWEEACGIALGHRARRPGGTMTDLTYGFQRRLAGTTLEEAREAIVAALKEEGFGVLTEIDVQATLASKLGVEFRPYRILGACNPQLAHRALAEDPHVGLLLPCNVVVQEMAPGEVLVSIADPRAIFRVVDTPALEALAHDVEQRLRRALDRIA